jgi:hypothetical protein
VRRLTAVTVALCSALVTVSPDALSWSTAPGDATTSRGYVDVAVAAPDPEATRLLDALDELTARLGLGVRATPGGATPWTRIDGPALDASERARVWIDARAADAVSLDVCVLHPGSPAACVHRTLARAGSSAVVVEEVAHLVHATLESELLAQPEPAPPLLPTSPAAPLVPPVAVVVPHKDDAGAHPARPSLALDAAAFVDGRMLAEGSHATLGGGGAVVVSSAIRFRPSLWLSAAIQTPFAANGTGLTLETTVSSFRAVPAVQVIGFRVLTLDLGAGGGADLFHSTPENPRLPYVGATPAPSTHVSPVFTGQLIAHLRLGPSARLLAGIDIDWSPGQRRYEILTPIGTPTAVLQPWTVRPGALLGLCIPLAGPGGCEAK